MKPADVCIAVTVAVISGLAFVASRIALNEFSPELMTTLRVAIAAVGGIAVMLLSKRTQAIPKIA